MLLQKSRLTCMLINQLPSHHCLVERTPEQQQLPVLQQCITLVTMNCLFNVFHLLVLRVYVLSVMHVYILIFSANYTVSQKHP